MAVFVNMMEYSDPEENAVAARTVWLLSFKKDIREKTKAEKGLLEALNKLKDSQDENTRTSAEGALWTINEKTYDVDNNTGRWTRKQLCLFMSDFFKTKYNVCCVNVTHKLKLL